MATNSRELVTIEVAKLETYDPVVTQNANNELYFNPLVLTRLDQTVAIPTEAVGYQILSMHEIALYYIEPGHAAAVPFKRSPTKRTGSGASPRSYPPARDKRDAKQKARAPGPGFFLFVHPSP